MGSRSYSFLDVAALGAVGPRLAAGEALVVLDTSLTVVLWANGAGARLFGAADPLSFIGADPALRGPVRRQIEATSGFPKIGQNRNLVLRLAGGLFSRTTAFTAGEIDMPDGEAALLFAAVPAQARPAGALEGLSGDGQYAALLDGAGNLAAAAEGFETLGIGPATLADLAAEVRGEADRMVKRPLRAAAGLIPAGIALLRDEPQLSLLVVVDEALDEPEPRDAEVHAAANDAPPSPVNDSTAEEPAEPTGAAASRTPEAVAAQSPAADPDEQPSGEDADGWYFNGARPALPEADGQASEQAPAAGPEAAEPQVTRPEIAATGAEAQRAEVEQSEAAQQPELSPTRHPVELAAVPVRFVWRTDAEGRFTTISDEFRAAFGDGAADVVGRSFTDVARVFGLDPGGEIAGLLARRDTWSGRAVLWPIAGTDLRAPVDLAALPVYDRDRNFEGFRGFGVARMGDAVIDPEAIGLALGGDRAAAAQPRDEDPFRGERPALVVTPTPERRETDKVIRLAERRPQRDLSTSEQNNFREIGERLRNSGLAAGDDAQDGETPPAAERPASKSIDPIQAADEALTELLAAETAEAEAAAHAEPEADPQAAAEFLQPMLGEENGAGRIPPAETDAAETDAAETGIAGMAPDEAAPAPEATPEPAASVDEIGEASEASIPSAASDSQPAGRPGIDLGAFAASNYDSGAAESHPVQEADGAPDAVATDAPASADAEPEIGAPRIERAPAVNAPPAVAAPVWHLSPGDEFSEAADEESTGEPPASDIAAPEIVATDVVSLSPADEMIAAADGDAETTDTDAAQSGVTSPDLPDEPDMRIAREAVEATGDGTARESDADIPAEPDVVSLSPADEMIATADDARQAENTETTGIDAAQGGDSSLDRPGEPDVPVAQDVAEPASGEASVQPGADDVSGEQAATAPALSAGSDDPSAAPEETAWPDAEAPAAADFEPARFLDAGEPDQADETAPVTGHAAPDEASADAQDGADGGPLPDVRGVDTALLSRLPLPVIIHRGDTLHFANREFLELTGYGSLEELDAAGGLGALFGDPYSQGGDRKLCLRTRSGAELPVDAFLQSVAWQGGKALLLSLKPVPVPAAQAPSDEFDTRLSELRTIIDTATDGVVLIENDGTIRSISRPAEALFGFEAEEVRGKAFATLFAMESQKAARDYLASLADNGVASVLNDGREVIGREAQGRFIPLFMTIGRLPQESGYCAVVRDITQFKRTEEELTQARAQAERASSQKTDFLARVSHEIRTPLNAIIGFSELMLDEKFGPITNERYKDYLRDINRSGNHVLDLVNDLLDISKIEAGQLELNYEAVSLNEAVGEAVAMMQPQANRERVIIRSSFASRLPDVVADLRSVRQIALNLLSNAIRYTPAGGQVIVSTSYEPAGDILLRVRDTGIGMAAAEIEQALKPFKQINALKRPRGDGTGLGLPLTKAMVEANRARFVIQSTPGEGTLVEIVFPSTRVLAH